MHAGIRPSGPVRYHPVSREPLQHRFEFGLDGAAGRLPLPAEKPTAVELQLGKKCPAHREEIYPGSAPPGNPRNCLSELTKGAIGR